MTIFHKLTYRHNEMPVSCPQDFGGNFQADSTMCMEKQVKAVKVKVAQSCPAHCDPMDYTVHGILQVRVQEWVAFPFSRGSPQPRDQSQFSRTVGRFSTIWATGRHEKQRDKKLLKSLVELVTLLDKPGTFTKLNMTQLQKPKEK